MSNSWKRDLVVAFAIVTGFLAVIYMLDQAAVQHAISHSNGIAAMPLSENIEDRRDLWGFCEPHSQGQACMEIVLRK